MRSTQRGLTLVELMVTLAVAIVLIAVGMPLFTGVAANNRAVAQANTFVTAFKLARSEAIKRATEVSVCALASATATTPACNNSSADWSEGLLVFVDDKSTAGRVESGEVPIRVFAMASSEANITATARYVRFLAEGEAEPSSLTTHSLCPGSSSFRRTCLELGHSGTSGTQTRCLQVTERGQVRLTRGACS